MTAIVFQAGPEQQVNTTANSLQRNASITALADDPADPNDGGWVVTWESNLQDGSGSGIYQQRYDQNGNAVGDEVLVNGTTSGNQALPGVAALAGGGWVVTWTSADADGTGIFMRRFDEDGSTSGSDIKVNKYETDAQLQSTVVATPNGGWSVAWQSLNQEGSTSGYGIYSRSYTNLGLTFGNDALINTTPSENQMNVSLAALADNSADPNDGGRVYVWESQNQDGSGDGIFMRRFGPGGAGAEIKVNTETSQNQTKPSVASLSDGGWVVTWTSSGQDGSSGGIYQQRYTRTGDLDGDETRVNSTEADDQSSSSVTSLTDGGWVVTWQSKLNDGSGYGIYQRYFDSAGDTVGPDLLVNTTTAQDQFLPDVTAMPDGGWVVAWQSFGQDGSSWGIYQKRYAVGGAVTSGQDVILGTGGDDTVALANGGVTDGDAFHGGAGSDTLTFQGELSWDVGVTTDFELLQGSAGDDALILPDEAWADLTLAFDGGAGQDTLQITTSINISLVGKSISGFEVIELTHPSGTSVMLDSKALALLVTGKAGGSDAIKLQSGSGTFTDAELYEMFRNGIETVVDDAGTHVNQPPTSISLGATAVAENAGPGTPVGALSGDDPEGGELIFTLTDDAGGRFDLKNGTLVVADGAPLDYEAAQTHTIKVKAVDPGGAFLEKTLAVTLTDVNEKPTAVTASGALAARELSAKGTPVATFATVDPDAGETFTYSLLNDAGGLFQIDGNELQVDNGVGLDFERSKVHTVKVQVADSKNNVFVKDLSIAVLDRAIEITAGSEFSDTVFASIHKDSLGGGAGNDVLKGFGAVDTLRGDAGNDKLYGGLGKDMLTGGKGKDAFVFDTRLAKANVDRVRDFNVKDDSVWLDNAVMKALGKGTPTKPVKLKKDAFWTGDKAHDATDRVVYNNKTGAVFYDQDGTGSKAAVQIATLNKNLKMTYADFFVI